MSERAFARNLISAAREAAEQDANDPHRDHHAHLDGTSVRCSCGEDFGVTCVAFTDDYDPDTLSCTKCGERGVVCMGGD
jgi:hypothetical protein